MPDYSANYADLERRLRALFTGVAPSFTPEQAAEVNEFLEAREYGLALETLATILVEAHLRVRPEVVQQVDDLAASMHIGGDRFVQKLHAYAR